MKCEKEKAFILTPVYIMDSSLAGMPGIRVDSKQLLISSIGFLPKDPTSWLYAARGLYKTGQYSAVVDALANCGRSPKTARDAQHLLAFSYWKLGMNELAAGAFLKSIKLGNEGDWQNVIELALGNPNLRFKA